MSSQFDESFDLALWPDKMGPFTEHPASFWRFSLSSNVQSVTVFTDRQTFVLNIQLGIILAFLDLRLRRSIAEKEAVEREVDKRGVSNGACQLAHYLQRLSNALEDEVAALSKEELMCKTIMFNSLRFWAIRTCHGFGHSIQGRNKYVAKCQVQNVKPYEDNPLHYSV